MDIKAIGFGLLKEEIVLINKMIKHFIEPDSIEVIDIKSYRLTILPSDVIITYGIKAEKHVKKITKDINVVINLPDVKDLKKEKGTKETPERKAAVAALKTLKNNIVNNIIDVPEVFSPEHVKQIKILLKNNKIIVSGKSGDKDIDILDNELKEFLSLLHHPAFTEVELDIIKS